METQRVIWKSVVGFEGQYEVSNTGEIRNYTTWKRVKPRKHPKGAYILCLGWGESRKTLYVHRIVAMAFLPNPEGCRFVRHKDGNKANNTPENLYWVDTTGVKQIKTIYLSVLYRERKTRDLIQVVGLGENTDYKEEVVVYRMVGDSLWYNKMKICSVKAFKTKFETVELIKNV